MEKSILILEKAPSNIKYEEFFNFPFTKEYLVEKNEKKNILKADITFDLSTLDDWNIIIPVGADVCKHVLRGTKLMTSHGTIVNEKFIPILSPHVVKFEPRLQNAFDRSIKFINDYIANNCVVKEEPNYILTFIQNTQDANTYLKKAIAAKPDFICLDTETSGLYPRKGYVLGISMSYMDDEGSYMTTDSFDEDNLELLKSIIDNTKVVFHHAKFDIHMLEYHFGLTFKDFEDTMLLHYALDENSAHGLKELAIKYTPLGDYDAELENIKKQICSTNGIKVADFNYSYIPFSIISKYAAKDVIATRYLFKLFWANINKNQQILNMYRSLLIEGTKFLIKMEENGVPFDRAELDKQSVNILTEVQHMTEELYKYPEVKEVEKLYESHFKVSSPRHVRTLLFDKLGIKHPGKKTDTGELSTDIEVLTYIMQLHPIVENIVNIKKKAKIATTYITKILTNLDRDNRLRTGFNVHTTTSGRLSSSGTLNMQQLPRDDKTVKFCIKARPGFKIVSLDLKTAEMWIAAALSGDTNLQEVFITGEDYHGFMAVNKFKLPCSPNEVKTLYPEKRQEAKTISFEILYKLNFKEPALQNFPVLLGWLKTSEAKIKKDGYIYTFFGRKRRLENVFSINRETSQHEIRSGVNALVQSTSSDLNLLASIDMQKEIERANLDKKCIIFALVHDSIIAEVSEDVLDWYTTNLKRCVQKDRGLNFQNTPIGVDIEIGNNYAFKDYLE
jgi:DNA polymerase I-like protein with 3'-5' exonuclease and polymerase domains